MSLAGIIPARAGSKRLPNKALLDLDGVPLVAHTCIAAMQSHVFDSLIINTDCPRIAATAERCGATCPALRPAALAADDTPTRDAMLFMLDLLTRRGQRYDALMILQPTSPLRTAADIVAAWQLYQQRAPCEVVSVTPLVPRSWLGAVTADGGFERWSGSETVYRLNGAIYLYGWDDFVAGPSGPTIAYEMPATRSVDIDTQSDLDLAAALLNQRPPAAERPFAVGTAHER